MDEPPELFLAEYDPVWPAAFDRVAKGLRAALHDLSVAIEHVGSTAVPGLAAKPVLDMDIVVDSDDEVPAVIERLVAIGYRSKGTRGIPGREALDQPPGGPVHYLYVVVSGSKPYLDHVLLRDSLRAHPERREAYEAVKRANAYRLPHDRIGYTDAKVKVIADLLARARAEVGLPADPGAVEVNGISFRWREPVDDADVDALHRGSFGHTQPGFDWRRSRPLSLGWVTASEAGQLVGFANVAWDGNLHAFLLDVAVAPAHQRRGIGRALVKRAISEARAADCEWIHVDYEPHLTVFYEACGFAGSAAGILRLTPGMSH